MNFGHYTAFAKNNGKWIEYNDSIVSEAENVCTSAAYVLFYQKRGF
jgi:ubiquitin C-terminal hydrolase